MANNATNRIMPGAIAEFRDVLSRTIPVRKLIRRIAEGLDATETKLAQFEGKYTGEVSLVAWEVRRRYCELAARLLGLMVERVEIGGTEESPPVEYNLEVHFVDPKAKLLSDGKEAPTAGKATELSEANKVEQPK